jgi:hypothetical protein
LESPACDKRPSLSDPLRRKKVYVILPQDIENRLKPEVEAEKPETEVVTAKKELAPKLKMKLN